MDAYKTEKSRLAFYKRSIKSLFDHSLSIPAFLIFKIVIKIIQQKYVYMLFFSNTKKHLVTSINNNGDLNLEILKKKIYIYIHSHLDEH